MSTYIYKAKKGPQELTSGQIEALNEEDALDKVAALGLVAISVTEKSGAKSAELSKTLSAHSIFERVTVQDVDIFTRQLASLIRASVPILRSLSLIAQQTENNALRKVVSDLETQIRDGKMLSESLAKYPHLFNNLYVNMVKSGEKGGALDEVLYNLALYREKEQEFRRKVQSALAYPILIILVGIATVFVMFTFFLPKLTVLFEGMKQALPLSTRILMRITEFMSGNWYLFIIALVFLGAIFGRVKQGTKKKMFLDFIELHIPIVKRFIRDAEVAKFARTLGLLIKNGISVCEAFEMATEVLDNEALKEKLNKARLQILNEGCALSVSLKRIDIFPKFAVNMISVGEEGGKLSESLKEIANAYELEVDHATKIMASLIEPLLILAVGAVVGFIVFAMLLPIFNIGATVK